MEIPADRRIFPLLLYGGAVAVTLLGAQAPPRQTPAAASRAALDQYCATCHNQKLNTAGLAFESLDVTRPGANPEKW